MTGHLAWTEPHNQPTLISELLLFAEAAYQLGRAIERGDNEVAARAQRVELAALGSILRMVDPDGREALKPPPVPAPRADVEAITTP